MNVVRLALEATMFPADHEHTPVSIEYDCYGGRRSKAFNDPYKAKRFYVSKFKSGRKPTVQRSDTMATAKKTTKKKTAKKASPKKKVVKKEKRVTVRVRALKVLQRKDMTAAQVQEAIELKHGLKPTLDQEVERKHLKLSAPDNESGIATYHLTAAGKEALKKGTVDPKRSQEG